MAHDMLERQDRNEFVDKSMKGKEYEKRDVCICPHVGDRSPVDISRIISNNVLSKKQRKADCSPDRTGARIYPFHDHRHPTPHFVLNISLTYKSVLLILPPSKSNILFSRLAIQNQPGF